MKIFKKTIAIVLIISVTLILLVRATYIGKSSEVTDINQIIPTKIETLEFYSTIYKYSTGELVLVYKDSNDKYYSWNSNVFAENEYEVHNELRNERYILVRHFDKIIGIFQIN